jgi:hypothetical protein
MPQLQLQKHTEEEALSIIINHLRDPLPDSMSYGNYENNLDILKVISECLDEAWKKDKEQYFNQNPGVSGIKLDYDTQTNSTPFYDASWNLCVRGILRPDITYPQKHFEYAEIIGSRFSLTPYGRQWLNQISGHECIPSEYGRFSQLLTGHVHRFGNGYHIRSQEAVSCYRAHTYLSCCVMCGAASESILLALAIAKNGDEKRIIKEYGASGGRTKIEKLLLSQQNSHIQKELPIYTSLLNYWRDHAAHGADTTINENEAFTSLLLLLRFAQFADEKWDMLTTVNSQSATNFAD